MSRKKKKSNLPAFLLFAAILLILAGTGIYGIAGFKAKKKAYAAAVQAIPPFSDTEQTNRICASLNIRQPLSAPSETEQSINDRISAEARKKSRDQYSPKELTRLTMDVMKKYRLAETGDKVNFLVVPSGESVKGLFIRKEDTLTGTYIVIETASGEQKYTRRQIHSDFIYLFSESDNAAIQTEKISALRKAFEDGRNEMENGIREELENKYFPEAGYGKSKDGKWVPDSQVLAEALEIERAAWKIQYDKKLRDLEEQSRFMGLISVVDQPASK